MRILVRPNLATHYRTRDTALPASDAIADLESKHDFAPCEPNTGFVRFMPRSVLDGGSSLLPPTGRARNLALGLRSFCAAVPMVEHIAEFCDLGVDALLLRLESSDRGRDDFI